MQPNVSQIVDSIHAVANDERVPVKERRDAVIEIAQAVEEHEDELTLKMDPPSAN
jgi:hypothetical protein